MRAKKKAPTTEIGYQNNRRQQVVRETNLAGNDHNQRVYVLECGECRHVYGANGSDIHIRKCPRCQDGRPGLAIDTE